MDMGNPCDYAMRRPLSRAIAITHRSATVFVAAVADQAVQIARTLQHRLDLGLILGVQRKPEDAGVVLAMLGDPQARADDDPGHGRAVQNVAHGHIGEADAVLVGNAL